MGEVIWTSASSTHGLTVTVNLAGNRNISVTIIPPASTPGPAPGASSSSYFWEGNRLYDLGLYAEAIAQYNIYISLVPLEPAAYNNRGAAYAMLGQYWQAILDYGQAIQLDPGDAMAYNNRGNAYSQLSLPLSAQSDWDMACLLDTTYC